MLGLEGGMFRWILVLLLLLLLVMVMVMVMVLLLEAREELRGVLPRVNPRLRLSLLIAIAR